MASVQASLRAFFRHDRPGIESVAEELNHHLHQNTEDSRYMTAILASLEPATGRLDYLNAGHVHPVLIRSEGSVERLDRGSTVLGLFPRIESEVGSCHLDPGDLVALYTDGLSEAEDPAGALFDEGRIVEGAHRGARPERPRHLWRSPGAGPRLCRPERPPRRPDRRGAETKRGFELREG